MQKKKKKTTFTVTVNFFTRTVCIPEAIVLDNGTQLTAYGFKEFCKMFSIGHITTPPYHPRSNGQAEMFVGTFKNTLEKVGNEKVSEEALQKFLGVYRIPIHRVTGRIDVRKKN